MLTYFSKIISIVVLFEVFYFVNGSTSASLTLVIKNTASMEEDIRQIKNKIEFVFNAILGSNTTDVDQFILVNLDENATTTNSFWTFNNEKLFETVDKPDILYQPETVNLELQTAQRPMFMQRTASNVLVQNLLRHPVWIKTKDPNEYRQALDKMPVYKRDTYNTSYVPRAVQSALDLSKENSYLYVFTDETAKEDKALENCIKNLAIKKSTQVTFVLTEERDDLLFYNELAAATFGEVLTIKKQDILKILLYILESRKHTRTILRRGILKPGLNQLQFNVDSKVWDIIVSEASDNAEPVVTGPDGRRVKINYLINTEKIKISKLETYRPGVYTIQLQNNKPSSITVTGSTNLKFKHGFSILKPESLSETSTQPLLGEKSYIALYIETNKLDVKLKSVELKEYNTILNLEQSAGDGQLYISESFVPLNKSFTLMVTAYTDSQEEIIRMGSTTIQEQDENCSGMKAISPFVTILGRPKLIVQNGSSLAVKCKIHAFPKPSVIWVDSFNKLYPDAPIIPVEVPYIYMSTLILPEVKTNFSISCIALNGVGNNEDVVAIQANPRTFLEIIKSPENITISYGETKDIELKVSADPSVNITWYKENKLISIDEEYAVAQSENSSVLTLKNMFYTQRGNYSVLASNGYHVKNITFKVSILAEKPEIDKRVSVKTVAKGSDVILNCSLLRGNPKPDIFWSYKNNEGFIQLHNDGKEFYKLKNVVQDDTGSYKCKAENIFGHDHHQIDLLVQYPPEIKENEEHTTAIQNEKKFLTCIAVGEPVPYVKWYRNNVEINLTLTGNYRAYRNNNMLRFTASLDDNAVFTCKATNYLGSAEKNISVKVLTYVHIDPPEKSVWNLDIGTKDVKFYCNAHGIPKPDISWSFFGFDKKTIRKLSVSADFIAISQIQSEHEGWYVCMAKNIVGYSTIAYEIHVREVPKIEGAALDNIYTGIEGDLVLRIPCQARGHPKPEIMWIKENIYGDNVALETDLYSMEEYGTLMIKNLDKKASGTYKCIAKNNVGNDSKEFTVIIEPYPTPGNVSTEIFVEEGTSVYIPCDLRQYKTDIVRWFKGEKLIHKGELTLSNVTTSDSGLYTCRMSNFLHSESVHKQIIVGPKPKFITDEETNIDYDEGSTIYLNCDVTGDFPVTVKWFHNDHLINETSTQIVRQLKFFDIGSYRCNVSNVFATNSRIFNIIHRECIFNIETDFNRHQPLLLNSKGEWTTLQNTNGFVRIPKGDTVYLGCPKNKITYKGTVFINQLSAICEDKTILKIQSEDVDFKELKCFKDNIPMILSSGVSCGADFQNNELITIGFNVPNVNANKKDQLLGVYDICFDRDMDVTIYAKHTLYKQFANKIPKALRQTSFMGKEYFNDDVELQYECDLENECCYTKRQLVSARHVLPGLHQVATFNYLNTVPHWSTCGTQNWDEIENRVRWLSQHLDENLEVWTGSSWPLNTTDKLSAITEKLSELLNGTESVAPYIWKVVKNPKENKALAIIQINIALDDFATADQLVTCRHNMCNEVDWMRYTDWWNIEKGLTFCCTIDEFKVDFDFEKEFRDINDVLIANPRPLHVMT